MEKLQKPVSIKDIIIDTFIQFTREYKPSEVNTFLKDPKVVDLLSQEAKYGWRIFQPLVDHYSELTNTPIKIILKEFNEQVYGFTI